MKSTILLFLIVALMASLSAQPERPQVLYSDTSHAITTAGMFVDRGDEYQLLTRKKNFGVIYYRMDTNFQVLVEHPTYRSSTVEDVIPLADAGVIATGYKLNGDYTSKLSAIKIAYNGSPEWQVFGAYEALGNGFGVAAQVESDNLLLIGRSKNQGYYDLTLTKIDTLGNSLWNQAYKADGQSFGMDVLQRGNGNYLATGVQLSPDTVSPAGWIVETNQQGDSLR
ncbi:MAG: hypothetical protein AAF399_29485, partial [Bacteroidota bacterium]